MNVSEQKKRKGQIIFYMTFRPFAAELHNTSLMNKLFV
jgi:hypothetical protein